MTAGGRRGVALATGALVLLVGAASARAAGPAGPAEEMLVQRGEVVRVGLLGGDGRTALQVRSRGGERTYVLDASTLVDSVRGGVDRLAPGDRVAVVAEPAGQVTRVIERPRRSWMTADPPQPRITWLVPPGALQP